MNVWTSRSRPTRTRCATRCARSSRPRRRRNTCGAWPSTTTRASRPSCGAAIVDLGWTGLLVPEALGGLGLGIVDAVVVQEEMGRAVFPGPFFSSAIVATLAARALGLDDRLARARAPAPSGERSRSTKPATAIPIERVRVRATGRGSRHQLDGVKPMVMDGASADWVLVPARTRDGLQTFLVENAGAARASSRRRSTSPASSPASSSTRRRARSSVRPAITPRSGAASPTTRRCCSRPS